MSAVFPDLAFLQDVGARLAQYLDAAGRSDKAVKAPLQPTDVREALLPFTEKGKNGLSREELLSLVDVILDHSVCTTHPGFLNQLYGGQVPEAIAGDWIATVSSTSMATFEISPVASVLESLFFGRLRELAGYPGAPDHPYAGATIVPGGSNGNMVALLTARNTLFPQTRSRGMACGPALSVLVSEEAHYSYEKAANIVGIGLDHVLHVRCDARGRMLPEALEEAVRAARTQGLQPFFVGATAGTTVKAACDPLDEIAEVAGQQGLWFHVDAALGGSLLFSDAHKNTLSGIERSDSFVWDAHKLMNAPLVASVLMCRDPEVLFRSGTGGGEDYLFHDERQNRALSWDSGECSLQCGRRPDILKIALMWLGLGEREWARRIEASLKWAHRLGAALAADDRFELVAPVESTSVCFRVRIPDEEALLAAAQAKAVAASKEICDPQIALRVLLNSSGHFMVNYAFDKNGKAFFRLVTINHLTTAEHYERLFDELLGLAGYAPSSLPLRF